MNLSKLQIEPVLRNNWEAMDIGVLMARRWYKPLLLAWVIPALICYIICSTIFYENPLIGITITWWLKPLFDRLPLYMLSRYLFGESAYRNLSKKALWKLYIFDLFTAITWRRLEFGRSFNLAITVLENQKGALRSARKGILAQNAGSAAGWLTVTLFHIEAMLSFSVLLLISMFIPEQIDLNLFQTILEQPLIFEHLYNFAYFCMMCLIAPFYVAGGFSLYINRRIELEAWDIELQFRHCMEKRTEHSPKPKQSERPKSGQSLASIFLFVLSMWGTLGFSDTSYAATDEAPPTTTTNESSRSQSKEQILTTLESPPFIIEKTVTQWEWQDDTKQEKDHGIPDWLEDLVGFDGLEDVLDSIAIIFEIIIWVLFALIIFLLVRSLINNFDHSSLTPNKTATKAQSAPTVIMGMEITQESLPDDIASAVKEALTKGDYRTALSLLYRFSLYTLIHDFDAPLESWHTEKECADIVQAGDIPEISTLFDELTLTWQLQAYAHRSPSESEVLSLSDRLLEVFKS